MHAYCFREVTVRWYTYYNTEHSFSVEHSIERFGFNNRSVTVKKAFIYGMQMCIQGVG
jgi:hypothetical protein